MGFGVLGYRQAHLGGTCQVLNDFHVRSDQTLMLAGRVKTCIVVGPLGPDHTFPFTLVDGEHAQ
jgi:hypothetical protein